MSRAPAEIIPPICERCYDRAKWYFSSVARHDGDETIVAQVHMYFCRCGMWTWRPDKWLPPWGRD